MKSSHIYLCVLVILGLTLTGCWGSGIRLPDTPIDPDIPDTPFASVATYTSWLAGIFMVAGVLGLIFYPNKRLCILAKVAGFGMLLMSQVMIFIAVHLVKILIVVGLTTVGVMIYIARKMPNLVEDLIGIDIPNYGDDVATDIIPKEAQHA